MGPEIDSLAFCREAAGTPSPTEGSAPLQPPDTLLSPKKAGAVSVGMKIGRAALDNSTQNTGRRFGLHTKAARVLIAFSVITEKKAPNYFLRALRMTGFHSANSEHRGATWRGDARFEKKNNNNVEVKSDDLWRKPHSGQRP